MGTRTHSQRTDELRLDREDGSVVLWGSTWIHQGTAFHSEWWRPFTPRTTRSVRSGDEVLVSGRLVRVDTSWVLEPITPRSHIGVVAVQPIIDVGAPSLLITTVLAAVAGLIWYGILVGIGAGALSHANKSAGVPFRTYELAAAMPASREAAIDGLSAAISGSEASDENLEIMLELELLADRCPINLLSRAHRFDDALAMARRCGTVTQTISVLAALGRYADAEQLVRAGDSSPLATQIHIANKEWTKAAISLETAAEQERNEGVKAHESCAAAVLRSFAGVTHAFDRVEVRGSTLFCRVAEGVADNDDDEILRAFAKPPKRDELYDSEANYLANAVLASHGRVALHDPSILGQYLRVELPLWWSPFASDPLNDPLDGGLGIHACRAIRAIEIGDLDQARRETILVSFDFVRQELLRTIEMRDGSPTTLGRISEDWVKVRMGGSFQSEIPGFAQAIATAQRGDGAALAAWIRSNASRAGLQAATILGALPLVRTNRAGLADAVKFIDDEPYVDIEPLARINQLSVQRDLAKLAGDADQAKAMQEIVLRHAAVLDDPRRLIAFQLVD